MFDLMYVNSQYQRQYAFLRRSEKSLLLVVVNFDDKAVDMNVMIPAHAFDYLNIKEKTYTATELLSGEKQKVALKRDQPVVLTLQPRGGIVLRING